MKGEIMNRDDIIRMALEADMDIDNDGSEWGSIITAEPADLERFFHMAQAAEREACAKVADEMTMPDWVNEQIAKAIRARGQA